MSPPSETLSRLRGCKPHKLIYNDGKTLFWDKNFGKTVPEVLHRLKPPGISVRYYLQLFPNTANVSEGSDDFWLKEVGERGWFVISQDYNLHVKENELYAMKQYDVGCFYLPGASSPKWDQFRYFMRAYDRIITAMSNPRPFLYDVQKNGTLKPIDLQ